MTRHLGRLRSAQGTPRPLPGWSRRGTTDRMFAAPAATPSAPDHPMLNARHLKAHRILATIVARWPAQWIRAWTVWTDSAKLNLGWLPGALDR